jgi:hypothetical protein
MDRLITFTEVDTTSPAEETITATTAPAEETIASQETVAKETEGEAISPEAMEGVTASPEAMLGLTTSLEAGFDSTLTIGAIDGETVVLFADAKAETTAATETSAAIGFEPMNFVTNLQYMGTGMLTIFIVIGAIILATTAINKIFSKKKD